MSNDIAYYITNLEGVADRSGIDPRQWFVTACKRGEKGHHPIMEYGAFSEVGAQTVADDLNKRFGLSEAEAAQIIASTMGKRTRRNR